MDQERIDGTESVSGNTPEDWKLAFDQEVARLARSGQAFTVYDVLASVGRPKAHPSAIGARMRFNSNLGVVERVGVAPRTTHGDFVTLWRGM